QVPPGPGSVSAMKTATFEVRGLFAGLDHLGVEKQLSQLPGVHRAIANPASGSVSVHYDETRTNAAALRDAIEECGFHCAGMQAPRHVCVPELDRAPPTEAAPSVAHDAMAHEMGHGAGMDMEGMARDMRNRFVISLVFSIPIFAMSPMGLGEPWI